MSTDITLIATSAVNTTSGYSISTVIPTSAQVGDLLIIHAWTKAKSSWDTDPPTGWNRYVARNGSSDRAAVFWKIAEAGDPNSTVTLQHVGSTDVQMIANTVWRGAKQTATPLAANVTTYSSALTYEALSIDVPEAGCVEVMAQACYDNYVLSTASGFTSRYSSTTTTGSDASLKMQTRDDPAVGATGVATMTQTYGDAFITFRFVILPESVDVSNAIMWGANF